MHKQSLKLAHLKAFTPLNGMAVGFALLLGSLPGIRAQPADFKLEIEQVTSGSRHHFFGYIGQC